jgi:hypothetical protein
MPVSISGTNGVTFPDSSLQAAAASPNVLKNRIINGAMQVWQRGTSFTVAGGAVTYTADRFGSYTNNTNMTISRNTSVPTTAGNLFPYSLQLQRPASSTQTNGLFLNQVIESVNCYDMAGQNVTLSFWAKAGANFSASGNGIVATIITGTVADQSNLSMLSGTWTGMVSNYYTPTITTTWTKYTYTIAIPSNVLEIGLQFNFLPTGTAGADDSLYITGVQLEVGTSATPFERRLYGQELALCQRYCEQLTVVSGSPNRLLLGMATAQSTTTLYGIYWYKVTKRVAPTTTITGTNQYRTLGPNNGSSITSIGTGDANSDAWFFTATATGYTVGQTNLVQSNDTATTTINWSAEL